MSPVRYQPPSANAAAVASGSRQYPENSGSPRMSSSPASSNPRSHPSGSTMRTSQPNDTRPALPSRGCPGWWSSGASRLIMDWLSVLP